MEIGATTSRYNNNNSAKQESLRDNSLLAYELWRCVDIANTHDTHDENVDMSKELRQKPVWDTPDSSTCVLNNLLFFLYLFFFVVDIVEQLCFLVVVSIRLVFRSESAYDGWVYFVFFFFPLPLHYSTIMWGNCIEEWTNAYTSTQEEHAMTVLHLRTYVQQHLPNWKRCIEHVARGTPVLHRMKFNTRTNFRSCIFLYCAEIVRICMDIQ